jgi:hypothetical protein
LRSAAEPGCWAERVLAMALFVVGMMLCFTVLAWLFELQANMAAAAEARACASVATLAKTEVRWLPYCAAARIHVVVAWFSEWNGYIAVSRGATVEDVVHGLLITLALLVVIGSGWGVVALWASLSHVFARRILDRLLGSI